MLVKVQQLCYKYRHSYVISRLIPILAQSYRWSLQFVIIQLYLTLVSLPIMIAWGLPISLLSPIGNVLFGPFLTVFLFLSTLLFFSELFYLPNQWLAQFLSLFTELWQHCLALSGENYYLTFAQPPQWIFVVLVLLVLFVLFVYPVTYSLRTVLFLTVLVVGVGGILKHVGDAPAGVFDIPCNRSNVTMIWDGLQVTVIDPGIMGSYSSASSWVQYTLLPEVAMRTGKSTIDHFIICKPSRYIVDVLELMVQQRFVLNLWLPFVPYYPIRKWCWEAKKNNIAVHYVNRNLSLPLNHMGIMLTVSADDATFRDRSYHPLSYAIDSFADCSVCCS